jgi:4-hydroxybenzoate polyprenyltransferase
LYPLAKRYTRYPQFVLGLAFNSGVIIGALTVAPTNLAWLPTLLMYGAGVSWTLVYDTVYAFQDISDDKKLGLKSTAITW